MDQDPKKKILIVEDEAALINILEDKFTHEGFAVFKANNGEEGLKIGLKEKPDMILLDVLMPKMNGLKMLGELRKNEWGENVPVLLLSNDDNPEHIRETLKFNASDFLIKSDWELKDIVRRVKEVLK